MLGRDFSSKNLLPLEGRPHFQIALVGPDAGVCDAARFVVCARHVEGQAVFVDGVVVEFGVTFRAHSVPCVFQAATARGHTGCGAVRAVHKVARAVNGPCDGVSCRPVRRRALGRSRPRRTS